MASTAAFDIGGLIEARPGVYGGRPCLAGTRFPILELAVLYNSGMSPGEIVERFAGLDLARVHAGIAYYLANRATIDAELARDRQEYADALADHRGGRVSLPTRSRP